MPFVSEAQRRKFHAMAAAGTISQETLKHWEDSTPKGAKLPERVGSHEKRAYLEGYSAALVLTGIEKNANPAAAIGWGVKAFKGLGSMSSVKNLALPAAMNMGVTAIGGGGAGDIAASGVSGAAGGAIGGSKMFAKSPVAGQMAGMAGSMGADHLINKVRNPQPSDPAAYANDMGKLPGQA